MHMAAGMAEGSTSAQHDIGELVNAQRGIEAEKISERKVNREGRKGNTSKEL